MISSAVPARPAGVAAVVGGAAIIGLGAVAAFAPDVVGPGWFVVAGVAAGLFVVALLGLWTVADGVRGARPALAVAAVGMALFGLAHFYTLVDEDTAIRLFSVFMVLSSVALVVGGIAVARAGVWRGIRRCLPLLCGVWPLATIPAGAAIGDVPNFLAIACWGVCWVGLGAALLSAVAAAPRSVPQSVR
jgi:hypothetical protein